MPRIAVLLSTLATAGAACSSPAPETAADRRARIEAMYAGYKPSFPEVADVSPNEVVALQQELGPELVLVDVREPREREVSMLPGAISREQFDARRDELAGRTVVAYCTIGYRSGRFADELRKAGVDARNLKGSILAWSHAGLPLVAGGEPTRRLHVYGADWDLAAEGYETVW